MKLIITPNIFIADTIITDLLHLLEEELAAIQQGQGH